MYNQNTKIVEAIMNNNTIEKIVITNKKYRTTFVYYLLAHILSDNSIVHVIDNNIQRKKFLFFLWIPI